MLLIKLGWRNILRNKRRTIISAIAISIGVIAIILTDALIIGMNENMIRTVTTSFLGEGQIHQNNFRDSQEVERTINNLDDVVERLKNENLIEHFALRSQSYAMISSPANVGNVMLFGIEPEQEKKISKLFQRIKEGRYLDTIDENGKKILIGAPLAKKLEVKLGEKVVVTVAQAHNGELSQELFRIGGVFEFGSREMDKGMVFVTRKSANQMLNIGNNAHEIALKFKVLKDAGDLELDFWKRFSSDGNKALSWKKIVPSVDAAIELNKISTLIITIIMFVVAAGGIMNTLFMSIYERLYEFGVLKSLGTRSYRIALMIVLEAVCLGVVSVIIGTIGSLIFGYLLAVYGIDYTGIEYASVTFTEPIYGVLQVYQFILFPLVVLLFTAMVAVYPAVYAARIKPVDAMKKSL